MLRRSGFFLNELQIKLFYFHKQLTILYKKFLEAKFDTLV